MTKAVVACGFLVAFAAGFVVGLRPREPEPSSDRPLAAELKLTPEQREAMHRIWSETASRGRQEREERRRELIRQRDEAILELIPPEDRAKYEEILAHYKQQMDAQDREWKEAFAAAVEQTKQILTPEQRADYEKWLERQRSQRGRPDWRHRPDRGAGSGRGPDRGPTFTPSGKDRGRDRNEQ
ncbi:MAG TPA: Spy/CpxP family protein refolding chaperone [Phycisphaerae bacterium]|nr:Spy/CpxP family protein refolding chaperone [Phycisphaerae bacterium]HOJ76143.1 Spy/CpxP family protein refolding chaperone [Phycisphaerae bacterium]HOM50935.1 Spy/CpxP family protein refolding chaperone [Phycisphaerae bacterium]HON65763.1 Spy/CpxP family protein refolding chaperone [Phycisphaerae bacterium]HOQ85502.1 Spy/CpxP family protein refolding chaperone [Phycisphaerae bacterium]